MPVSEDVFNRLSKTQPYKSEEQQATESEKADTEAKNLRVSETTSFGEAVKEHAKAAIAGSAELANAGARMYMRSIGAMAETIFPPAQLFGTRKAAENMIPDSWKRGAPSKAIELDEEKIKREGPVAKAIGPMVEGAVSIFTQPGGGPIKTAEKGIKLLTELGAAAVKKATLGAGMGEGSEAGKWVFGGFGEALFGEEGREAGEAVGSVAGGAAGGYANVIRYNAVGQVIGKAYQGTKGAVGSVLPAIKETIAAKKAGDMRSSWEIFTGHYSALRDKAVGMLQQSTNQQVAGVIQRDPRHQEELNEFDNALREIEGAGEKIPPTTFSTGQRAANRTLTQLELQQKRTADEAAAADAKKKDQQSKIMQAYKKIVGKALPLTWQELKDSMDLYRTGTLAHVDNIAKAETEVKSSVPNWSDTNSAEAGSKLRDIYDTEHAAAKKVKNDLYGEAYKLADAENFRADLSPVAKATKEVLKPLLSRIDKGTAPESIRALNNLLTKEARAAEPKEPTLQLSSEDRAFYMKNQVPEIKGHSFKDVHDVIKKLGEDANDAFKRGDTTEGRNLNQVGEALKAELKKQAPKASVEALTKADINYQNDYVPRFKEGVNFNLDREATAARRGREKITDQNIWPQYLNKKELVDNMQQFDNLFGGGRGAPRNDAAYKGLSEAVGDRYSKEVLTPGFTRERHEKFMREYNSALDRVPGARKNLDTAAVTLDKLNNHKERVLDNYKIIMGSRDEKTMAREISPAHAQHLLTETLADPGKMKELLNSPLANTQDGAKSVLKQAMTFADPLDASGRYDPDKLMKLLTLGEKVPGQPTGLQMLFDKALNTKENPQAGAQHMARLKAIDTLMKREAMTDAKYMRFEPQEGKGPVAGATGQTMASWIGQFYATESGRIGKPFALVTAGGRFVNNKMQQATTKAMERALYDPEMSAHILELVQTPSSQPISAEAFKAMYGGVEGASKIMRDLLDHGTIRFNVARGATYGLQSTLQDQQKEKDKEAKEGKRPKRQLRMPVSQ